jgi:hypothetical protein
LVVAAIGIGLFASRSVWEHYAEQRTATDAARHQMLDAEAKRADLMRQRADLASEAGREREARERGWRRPDEKPLSAAGT